MAFDDDFDLCDNFESPFLVIIRFCSVFVGKPMYFMEAALGQFAQVNWILLVPFKKRLVSLVGPNSGALDR